MARPRETLAVRLSRAEEVAVDGVLKSADLSRTDREALTKEGWLLPITRGWYLFQAPTGNQGDSTPWFSSIWAFVRSYFTERFGDGWCLSAVNSLALHAGNTTIPGQIVAITRGGAVMTLELPHSTSLLMYPDPSHLPESVELRDGLRLMKLSEALLRAPSAWFRNHPSDATIALRLVREPIQLARTALETGPVDALGRLIGGWRAVGDASSADAVARAALDSGRTIVEVDPFAFPPAQLRSRPVSPYAGRVSEMWARMREPVVAAWPAAPETVEPSAYLDELDSRAERDAWHSLSIEGYRVTPELIRAVRDGGGAAFDATQRDELAASGYLRAQKAVRRAIAAILDGGSAAAETRRGVQAWYQEMFGPHVEAGLIERTQLLGYRTQPVFLRGSRHVPPPSGAVADAMDELFERLENEESAAVRAVLGHFVFTWIHPFGDGNGRIGRFLMNVHLASAGFPWTVVRVTQRPKYMQALESASVDGDIRPFESFVRGEMAGTSD